LLKVLLCTANADFNRGVVTLLQQRGFSVRSCTQLERVGELLEQELPDLLVSGWRFKRFSPAATLRQMAEQHPTLRILIWSSTAPEVELPWPRLHKPCRLSEAVAAIRASARPSETAL
jgi:DNA-binding response OmpR family regulator